MELKHAGTIPGRTLKEEHSNGHAAARMAPAARAMQKAIDTEAYKARVKQVTSSRALHTPLLASLPKLHPPRL